jgi:hypothetical protein
VRPRASFSESWTAVNLIDESEIRKFLGLLHSRAAGALNHMRRPGVLQLVSIFPCRPRHDGIAVQYWRC